VFSLQEPLPERIYSTSGFRSAGVDEAGRGPLAGEVFAAAVILDHRTIPKGLNDSKKLTARKRERLEGQIIETARDWCVATASVDEIDTLNILQASLLAMSRAVSGLKEVPEWICVDGNQCPEFSGQVYAVIQGDSRVPAISAASILAKEARDRAMLELAKTYPEYGFDRHKGYPTPAHLRAIEQFGVSPVHRNPSVSV
jgi:ribonuclease HII